MWSGISQMSYVLHRLFWWLRYHFLCSSIWKLCPNLLSSSSTDWILLKNKPGNAYFLIQQMQVENDYRVYVCMWIWNAQEWNKKLYSFDSLDQRKQPVKSTLIRFRFERRTKRWWRGFKTGWWWEVHSIERGIADVYYEHISSIKSRLLQILWEYHEYMRGGDPSGHSVTQRLEFWRRPLPSLPIIPWTGVGTGDMPEAYGEEYQKMNTQLMQKYRLRAHNQCLRLPWHLEFLLWFISFHSVLSDQEGTTETKIFFLLVSGVIAFFHVYRDTLETQAGATFVALFWSLFLFSSDAAEIEDVKNQFWDDSLVNKITGKIVFLSMVQFISTHAIIVLSGSSRYENRKVHQGIQRENIIS